VAVVGRGREEQLVLKAAGQFADGPGELGVDGNLGAAGGGGVVGLIEDQQRFVAIAEPIAQGAGVVLVAHQRLAQDEAGVGGPGVDAPAPLAPHARDVIAVHHRKRQAEAAFHFALPLQHHHALHLLAQ